MRKSKAFQFNFWESTKIDLFNSWFIRQGLSIIKIFFLVQRQMKFRFLAMTTFIKLSHILEYEQQGESDRKVMTVIRALFCCGTTVLLRYFPGDVDFTQR